MMKLRFLSILVCAAALGCGGSSTPSDPQSQPGPPPPPPPPPPPECPDERPAEYPVLASGDLVVRGYIHREGPWHSFGFAALRADTLEFVDLIARDACGREVRGWQLDRERDALMQLMGPPVGTDPPTDYGLLTAYRFPSTVPTRAFPDRQLPAYPGPAPAADPSVFFNAGLDQCDAETSRMSVSVLHASSVVVELPVWESPCTAAVYGGPSGVSPDGMTAIWSYRHPVEGGDRRMRFYSIALDPVGEVRELGELGDNLDARDLKFDATAESFLTTARRVSGPDDGTPGGASFPPIDGFYRIGLDGAAPVRLNPPPDDGFGITQFYDGAGQYLLGDGSGAVWFEGDWSVDVGWGPPATHDRTTSPLWYASVDQPGVRVQINAHADEYIHAFETEHAGSRVAYLSSRGAHDAECVLSVADTATGDAPVELVDALACGGPMPHHPLQFVRRAGERDAVGVAFRQGQEWFYRPFGAAAPVWPLGETVVREPAVDPSGQWLYFIAMGGLQRLDLASGEIAELDVDVGLITTLHVVP